MDTNQIILEYFKIVLSWPTITLVLGVIFLFKFSSSIKIFLENLRSFKAGLFELSQQQGPSQEVEKKVEEKLEESGIVITPDELERIQTTIETISKEKEDKEVETRYFFERAELYEFAYLNLYLVYNSKQALLWFYAMSSTRENFINSFSLPPQIVNQIAEKEVIFNTLIVNGLIEQDGILFKITEKGKRFLKYLGYNINI